MGGGRGGSVTYTKPSFHRRPGVPYLPRLETTEVVGSYTGNVSTVSRPLQNRRRDLGSGVFILLTKRDYLSTCFPETFLIGLHLRDNKTGMQTYFRYWTLTIYRGFYIVIVYTELYKNYIIFDLVENTSMSFIPLIGSQLVSTPRQDRKPRR